MNLVDVKVPDLGDVDNVAVIEILVQPGDVVRAEQGLVTVESDKASLEIPAPQAGVVKELKVKLGDTISQGSMLLVLESHDAVAAPEQPGAVAPVAARPSAPPASAPPADAAMDCDLLVLGGGPGGYSAAFRAADLGLKVILVERYAELGGVCLNVGCIPSKALLHVAAVMDEAQHLAAAGVSFGAAQLDLPKLRAHKQKVVTKLTGGLAMMAKLRKVSIVRGFGHFIDAHHIEVEQTSGAAQDKTGQTQTLSFKRCIIAVGSQAVHLPFLPDDPRVVDSTGALGLPNVPKRLLIIGGGIIGLEMGTVYSSLGARLDVVEMQGALMQGVDRDLVGVWQKINSHRFDRVMLQTKTVSAQATADGIAVSFDGPSAPQEPQVYDLVLQAVGRSPNGRKIGAEQAGIQVSAQGFIPTDAQMRTSAPHIFAIGDVARSPMLAHKAVHEGHVAAEVVAGELLGDVALGRRSFDARVIPGVAYTDPEVAWAGVTEEQAQAQGLAVKKALFPWAASGRAIANGRDEGLTKLLFDRDTHRIVGGGIVGTHAGELIGEVCLAIEMGADAVDIGRTIHPHPTLSESIGLAAEVADGACTDLPPPRR